MNKTRSSTVANQPTDDRRRQRVTLGGLVLLLGLITAGASELAAHLGISLSLVVTLTGVLASCAVALWAVPRWQAGSVEDPLERSKFENEARRTLAQVFGGIALLTGLGFTWIQITDTEQHNRQSQIVEDFKLRNEQFARAVEKLSNPEHVEVRLAGIYGLGQLADRSRDDFWPVMELLTAYIREHAQWTSNNAQRLSEGTDIQAALKIVIWRETGCDPSRGGQALDLHGADLGDYDLTDASLASVDLRGTNLEGAILNGAVLRGATVGEFAGRPTTLSGAFLMGADLRDIDFGHAGMRYDDWNVYLANVHGVVPESARSALVGVGAVDQPDEKSWSEQRSAEDLGSDRPRLFGPLAGCLAPLQP